MADLKPIIEMLDPTLSIFHGTLGTIRHKRDIMIAVMGYCESDLDHFTPETESNVQIIDLFLTIEQAKRLLINLSKKIETFDKQHYIEDSVARYRTLLLQDE